MKLVVVGGRFPPKSMGEDVETLHKYGGKDTQKRSGRKSQMVICCAAELSTKI
jgi:hypothetical protein